MLTPQEKRKIREEFKKKYLINYFGLAEDNYQSDIAREECDDKVVDYFLDIIDKKVGEERKRIMDGITKLDNEIALGERIGYMFSEVLQIINNKNK